MADSIFDSDPTEMPASQRLAQAHAATGASNNTDDIDRHPNEATVRTANGTLKKTAAQGPDITDESAFPSLGGAGQGKTKSIWGASRTSRPATPMASQVIATSGLITDTVKLEAAQQQSRTLGRHSASEVVKNIQKSTNTTIQTSTAAKTGTTTFLIKGSPEDVTTARKAIVRELGKKITVKIPVPSGVRPYIVGAKGRTLKGITERTGVKVQLPRRDEGTTQDDPDELVEITLDGDFEGVSQARAEIEAIVAEKTSSSTTKITHIPAQYYGQLSLRLSDIVQTSEVSVTVPSIIYADHEPAPITLSGPKEAIGSISEEIEKVYAELQSQTISTSLPLPLKQHRFVVSAIPQILAETGCSIILPHPTTSTETVTIRGAAVNIGAGITRVMEAAQSMTLETLEVSRAHATADDQLQHALNLTRVLLREKRISDIARETSTRIEVPSEQDARALGKVMYELSGRSASSVTEARKQVVAAVNRLQPSMVTQAIIEPLLHRQLIGPKNKNIHFIRKQAEVDVIFPTEREQSDLVVLAYAGNSQEPSTISAQLSEATRQVTDLVAGAGEIFSETINIPSKHHAYIMGANGTTLNAITGGSEAVVRVLFGENSADGITIHGPRKDVERVSRDIRAVAETATNSEGSDSTKVEFDFPPQFTKNLIGRGGSNISKIRDELGVKIDVGDEGRIVIQGPQRNVDEAKSRISLLGDRLQDETTFVLKIPADFHGQIIGQGGKLVKRLEEKYQVQINFPRTGDEQEEDTLHRDQVSIKGGKKGATAAKQEIMELFHYENEHSYTSTIEVLQKSIPQIVGKNGQVINDIKDETNTRIDIDKSTDTPSSMDLNKVVITIKGRKADVEKAKSSLMAIDSEVADLVVETIQVDPAYHRNLIGPGGSVLRELVVNAGGPEDSAQRARMVRFPKAGDNSSDIVLRGPKAVVEKIKKSVERLIGTPDSQHTETITVARDQVKLVIGRGGSKKSQLESTHSVIIDVPRSSDTTDTAVKVLGKEANVRSAIQEIKDLVKVPESTTIQVPRTLHRTVADNGSFIRRLRSEYRVNVDHAGHSIPKPPTTGKPLPNGTARIDDDVDGDYYPFHVSQNTNDAESGDIPWVLKGEANQIAKATNLLTAAIESAKSQTHTAQLHIPTSKHRYIIGQGGSTINGIRDECHTKIDVPKSQTNEVITIKGSLDGCERARIMIIEAIQKKT